MKKLISTIVLALSILSGFQANATFVSPLGVSIVPPVQFPPTDFDVAGVRLGLLWGRNRSVYGLDVGLLGNITEQTFSGIGISGLVNYTKGTTTGILLQAAGLANINLNKTMIYGLQFALVNYNAAESGVGGFQLGLINQSAFTTIYGLQFGIYNKARVVKGLQIGLLNFTEDLHGIQIGLLNFNHTGLFVVSPVLNVGF
jgi:hypothetical protein